MNGYAVIVEKADDGGYGAWSPELPGCVATGASYEQCVADMRDAVKFHLDGMREDGLAVPPPRAVGVLTICAA